MIKTVMVDMDGTLLTDDKKITEKTVNVIKEFQQKGGNFVINTGRGYVTANKILNDVGIYCDCICMSGAAIYNKNGECIMCDPMTKSEILAVRKVEKKYNLYVNYILQNEAFSQTTYDEAKQYYLKESFTKAKENGVEIKEEEALKAYNGILNYIQYGKDINNLIESEKEIYKMVVMCTDENRLEVENILRNKKMFLIANTGRFSFEVNATRVDKGQAAMIYAMMKDIPIEEIMVIGDSENDKSMLNGSFGKSVAMANATNDIKKLCTDVTYSNMEDGVAYAIKQWAL